MKVAKKSPRKRRVVAASRATLTLPVGTYRIIDELRGDTTRSAWLESLVGTEKVRREREALAALCRQQYTPEVCRETLRLNRLYPIHEG
ncbi:MAG: hypothetical protein ABI318_06480 [Chthoniobacteraceae bacterium]